ncbi:Rieske (2Fe-2S) protein [Pilimelia columellifera]|uniref:Rieske (2Fe-2S) protein n=1 Tax=Pilimelia columellifera subsp. columellifera TaxID=706583 RepID=A0ABP6AX09_9ACTN
MSNDAPDTPVNTPAGATGGLAAVRGLCPSRRSLLAIAGGISVTAVLAACSDDYSGYTLPQEDPNAQGNADPSASSDGGGDGGGGGGDDDDAAPGDSGGGAEELAATDDIPVGGGKVVDGVLIMQPAAGRFRAFNAACPHQGVQVSAPKDGAISCSAHGSEFALNGDVTNGPAKKGLSRVKIRVKSGKILRA